MQIWLPVIIYGTTAALGLVLGWYFLSDKRPPQGLQALHLVIGIAGLEVVILVSKLHRGNQPVGDDVRTVLVLLGLAVFTGLVAGTMAKPRSDFLGPALLAHAAIGGTGFLLLANWAINA